MAQYRDIDELGRPHEVEVFPHTDGLLRQTRCSRSGQKLAGIGSDDHVWERIGDKWFDRGPCYGPRSCIYRGEELIIRREWPAYGFRYIAPDGTPVTATETYAHPTLKVWEYTQLPNGMIVGQGGEGPHGLDPLIIVMPNGTRKVIREGMCRFINAYLVGSNIMIAWQQDGKHCDSIVLPVSQVGSYKTYVDAPPPIKPEPKPQPKPEPEKQMFDYAKGVVEKIDRDYPFLLQDNTRESCGEFTERVVLALAAIDANWGHVKKQGAQTQYRGHAVDAVMYRNGMRVFDIIGGAEGHPARGQAKFDEVPNGDQPWMEPIQVLGESEPPVIPDPPRPIPDPVEPDQDEEANEDLISFLDLMIEEQIKTNEELDQIKKNSAEMVEHLKAIRGDMKNFTEDFKAMLPDILKAISAGGLGNLGGLFGKK